MENNMSILSSENLDATGQQLLKNSGTWAKFIGIVYLVLSVLILLTAILIFANLDAIASALMDINGFSQEALQFMMGSGKWLFILMMILSSAILIVNGLFLVRFSTSSKKYSLTQNEDTLSTTFLHLSHYFMITSVLSIVSTLFTIAAIIYYFVK